MEMPITITGVNRLLLSKNFSFWTVPLDLDTMFKIKSLLYKDLILNSLSAMLIGDAEKVTNFYGIPILPFNKHRKIIRKLYISISLSSGDCSK